MTARPEFILEMIRPTQELREKIRYDPHRPRYHLVLPERMFNGTNGGCIGEGGIPTAVTVCA